MHQDDILRYCLQKEGAYLDLPFGPGCECVKLRGHIFAQLFLLKGVPMVTLKCEPSYGDFFRRVYPDIVTRGWHCPPVQQPHWNTIRYLEMPDEELLSMIDHAYLRVRAKLTKKEREGLSEVEA